jgi:hypothetical protein
MMSKPGRIVRPMIACLVLLTALAGCATSRGGSGPAAHPKPVSTPGPAPVAPCAGSGCRPGPAQLLTGGYSVRLWISRQPSAGSGIGAERSTPVLELSQDGQHVSWWVGRLGFGWAATLRCLATAGEPNCVVLAEVGAHAGSAEVVLLRSGALVAPARASVVFDSGAPSAADFDHDGLLDVLGIENDYRPNYAQGHNYFTTYRLAGDALHQTGCLLQTAAGQRPPSGLLTGRCPVVSPG